jgi:ribosomal protein S18 acetylase RimI-like enzyme
MQPMSATPHVRRTLRPGDLGAVVEHHGRLYAAEHGVNSTFEGHVAASVARAATAGFPSEREAICIVELGGEHAGSIGLTDNGDGTATLRWVLLDAALRGSGLGRALVSEMVAFAGEIGYAQLVLETFSELEAAAHLYRDHGFELVWEDTAPRWGRDRITYQRYELDLAPSSGLNAGSSEPHAAARA